MRTHIHAPPQPLAITLRGLTNEATDPSVDVVRTVTLPLLRRLGVEDTGLELKVGGGGGLGRAELRAGAVAWVHLSSSLAARGWVLACRRLRRGAPRVRLGTALRATWACAPAHGARPRRCSGAARGRWAAARWCCACPS